VVGCVEVRDHEERAFLEQNDLAGFNSRAEPLQAQLQLVDVGQKDAHDGGPRLVKCLIPDTCTEALRLVLEGMSGSFHDARALICESLVAQVFSDQVHLVDKDKNLGVLR